DATAEALKYPQPTVILAPLPALAVLRHRFLHRPLPRLGAAFAVEVSPHLSDARDRLGHIPLDLEAPPLEDARHLAERLHLRILEVIEIPLAQIVGRDRLAAVPELQIQRGPMIHIESVGQVVATEAP